MTPPLYPLDSAKIWLYVVFSLARFEGTRKGWSRGGEGGAESMLDGNHVIPQSLVVVCGGGGLNLRFVLPFLRYNASES